MGTICAPDSVLRDFDRLLRLSFLFTTDGTTKQNPMEEFDDRNFVPFVAEFTFAKNKTLGFVRNARWGNELYFVLWLR